MDISPVTYNKLSTYYTSHLSDLIINFFQDIPEFLNLSEKGKLSVLERIDNHLSALVQRETDEGLELMNFSITEGYFCYS
jgi:hypothetical protein